MNPNWSSLIEEFSSNAEHKGQFQIRMFVTKDGTYTCEFRKFWRGKLIARGEGSSFQEAVEYCINRFNELATAPAEVQPELFPQAEESSPAEVVEVAQ